MGVNLISALRAEMRETLCDRLLRLVQAGLATARDPLIELRVKLILAAIVRETRDDYVSEKAARINYWVRVARSGTGQDGYETRQAEAFAMSDAYRLAWQVGLSAREGSFRPASNSNKF